MSGPKPTADTPSRAKRLGTWWEGWPRLVVLGVTAATAAIVSFGAVRGILLVNRVDKEIPRVHISQIGGEDPTRFDRPRNVLIVGSDTRRGLPEEQQAHFGTPQTVVGERSDTIILMHLDPKRDKGVVLHFPRDLRVRIPGHGFNKINAAYELGNAPLTVRTVEAFTGLQIHNYIEVDLAGFQKLVDLVGGVRICVDRPMFDQAADLSIPRAGCHTLNGAEALAFVRARHIEGDLIPDFSRISRQQQFMRAMLNRVLSVRSLLDDDLVLEATQYVTTDQRVSATDFLYLTSELRRVAETDPSGAAAVDFRVVPSTPAFIEGVSYVVAEQPKTDMLFRRMQHGEPLGNVGKVLPQTQLSPAQIIVQARDGGDTDETDATTAYLRRAGFRVLDPGAAPSGYQESAILYRPGSLPNAQVVKGYFDQLEIHEAPPEIFGDRTQVLVIVGPDFAQAATP
jgi:LCP family protein required for cell wall assembly